MSDLLRIGLIGAGQNTKLRHIPGFQEIEGVELNVICNRSRESSRRVADEFGIPRIASTWQEVANDPEVDAICIGTWPNMHAEISIAALNSGKHVLTEARMSRNLSEAEAMLAASKKHPDRVAQIVPAPFSLDYDAAIKAMLESGELGDIREVIVTHTTCMAADSKKPLSWRQDAELSGKNVMTMGIAHETVQRWLGEDPLWIRADASIATPERWDEEAQGLRSVEIPDSLSINGRFRDGARLCYHFSGLESGLSRKEIRLNASKHSLRLDLVTRRLFKAKTAEEGEVEVIIPEADRRGWRVEADFVASIRQKMPVTLTSFEQGVRYMKFTEYVHQSWTNEGMRVIISGE